MRQFDAVTGNRDGSVRAYALATEGGLYVAILSSEPRHSKGATGEASGAGAGPEPPRAGEATGKSPAWAVKSDQALLRDWMAVRVQGAVDVFFLLDPWGRTVSFGEDGRPSGLSDLSWMAAGSRFGNTWAGEWLIPWPALRLKGGETFRLSALRGRKLVAQGTSLELLNTSAPVPSAWRWGGDGPAFVVPAAFGSPSETPSALAPFEIRPFLPPTERRASCDDAAPAGEFVTAWLECPPSEDFTAIEVKGPLSGAEVFLVDFWWQSGRRDEQDALIPARALAGAGDVLVAERLFPQGPKGLPASPWPLRAYLRCRIPKGTPAGLLNSEIIVKRAGKGALSVPWTVQVAPALPPTRRLASIYYLEKDPRRWPADLADVAAHGFNAVTCPADPQGRAVFMEEAARAGLDGRFLLHPGDGPAPPGAWGYAADEPATEAAMERTSARIVALRKGGYKPWAALCWPNSLGLVPQLDGVAFDPSLIGLAGKKGFTDGRWIYIQGLREDPFYNRLWAGVLSFARGLSGFWVFCYAPQGPGVTDWTHPFLRRSGCVEEGPNGARIQTVEWEALREGSLDARLREALGPHSGQVDTLFPQIQHVLDGEYWLLDPATWDVQNYRRILIERWRNSR